MVCRLQLEGTLTVEGELLAKVATRNNRLKRNLDYTRSCWGGPDKEALLTNMEVHVSAGLVSHVSAEVAT